MPRKPIVPVFATSEPAPTIPLFAGAGETKPKKDDTLPLAYAPGISRLGVGTEWHIVVAAVLLGLILVAYGNSFQSEWVLDNKYIIELDPRTKATSWEDTNGKVGVNNIFKQDYWWPKGISGLYRPITSFTYWLNWTAFGNGHNPTPREQVVGFHWVNLIIHFLNAFLFYRLMLRLVRRFWVSFFAAVIFAMHPVATESVTNIIGRADMFAATTVVGGMLIWIDIHRSQGWKRLLWLTALLVLTLFGVFSKESAGAIVFVAILYDLVYRVGERIRELNWRELIMALVRACTITPLVFFSICAFLLILVPWMSDMGDIVTPYVYSHSTATGDPGHGKVQFNNDTPASSAAIYVSNLGTDNRTLRSALQSWADADGNLSGKLEVTKAADTNQKILFDVTGKLEKGAEFTKLLVQHVDYTGTFTDGDQLAFSFKDGRFPWAILGTVIALAPIFMATVFLSRRRMDVAVLLAACGVLMLVLLAASYRPRVETLPPGAGLLLTRLHLTPNPSAPDQIDAATKAASAELPNPVVLAIKHTVIWCLLLALVLFAAVEAIFQFVWTDAGENPKTLEKWKGFFDGYYVLLSVSIMLLVVRDWVFANTTPAEEPFLDNPLRGLGFIGSRMTAFKVWESLLWKLVWPVRLSSDYSYNQIPLFGWHGVTFSENLSCVAAMFLFFGVLALAVWCWWKGQKAIAFFIALFFINYLPTGNFLYIIGSIMAERFMYLPLIGFAACIAIGADLLARLWVGALDDADTTVISDPQGAGGNPNLAEYRYVPHIVLGLLVVLYGVRSFYRNFDWHTDVTLWAAAKTESPISFRSYQSYAFALFEQDAAGNCDRMIQTDEDGLKIVDDLPNPLNSSRLYLHLGMYYGLKGELLSKPVTNSIEVTEAAVPWFQKSAGILERGVPVDRAFNEVNRGRDVKRGRNGEDTPDVGLAPVYGYLGVAYLRVNRLDEAEQAFRYMRHLECTDPDAYLKLASVYERRNQFDKEAVCLMQVILLDKDNQHPEAWPALNEVFKRINTEPYPCIIQNAAGRAQLDLSRTAVRDTVLDAYRDFVRVFQQAKRKPLAEGARDTAVKQYGFSKEALFDPLFDPTYLKQFPIPVPPDPVFWKPPKVKFELMMPEVQKAVLSQTNNIAPEWLQMEMLNGRAIYTLDQPKRIRVSEEGVVLPE